MWQVYAAWTINGYIGVALLMMSRAEHYSKADLWNKNPGDRALGAETVASQYLPANHATHLGEPRWSLLGGQPPKFYEENSIDTNQFHANSEIRKDSFLAQIPTSPPRRRRAANKASTQPSPARAQGPLFESLGAIRISEDDTDLLPSVALVALPEQEKDCSALQATTLPVLTAPPLARCMPRHFTLAIIHGPPRPLR